MSDNLKEQFDKIAERIGASAPAAPARSTRPARHDTYTPPPAERKGESRYAYPGERRTVIVDDDMEGGQSSRPETDLEYRQRLFASEIGAATRMIGEHDGYPVWVRWLRKRQDAIGLAWIEASVPGTYGYWHRHERCTLEAEAQVLPEFMHEAVLTVGVTTDDCAEQCVAAVQALIRKRAKRGLLATFDPSNDVAILTTGENS